MRQQIERLIQSGKLQDAIVIAEQQYRKEPSSFSACFNLGFVAHVAKDFNNAIPLLRRAHELKNHDIEALFFLALSLQSANQIDEAINTYRQLLQLDGDNYAALVNLALCLERLERWDESNQFYEQALKIDPSNPDLLVNYGNFFRKQNKLIDAASYYERSLSTSPTTLAYKNYAHLKSQMMEFERSRELYKKALTDVNQHEINTYIANTYFHEQQYQVALEHYLEVLEKAPNYPAAVAGRIRTMAKLDQSDEAIALAENTIPRIEHNDLILDAYATVVSQSNDFEQLNKTADFFKNKKGLNISPTQLDNLAIMLVKTGNYDDAINYRLSINQESPGDIENIKLLADAFFMKGDYESAVTYLEGLVATQSDEQAKEDSEVFRQLGINYLHLNDFQQAEVQLERSLAIDSRDQRTLAFLIVTKQALNKHSEVVELQSFEKFVYTKKLTPEDEQSSSQKFNEMLEKEIKQHSSLLWEPRGLATVGGFMTANLADINDGALGEFNRQLNKNIEYFYSQLDKKAAHPFLREAPKSFKVHSWAVVLSQGGYVSSHIHEESALSGVYYIRLPDITNDSHEGWLEFGEPHDSCPVRFSDQNYYVKPEEGKLVLFPSYYFHRTIQYSDDNERICIAFDVEVLD